MTNRVVGIPVELKTAIFRCLNDFDDVLHLSQVCKDFRALLKEDEASIVKEIIISSDVHEFDLCLSRLQKISQTSAECYHDHGKQLGNNRPPLETYTSWRDWKDSKRDLTDDVAEGIVSRWKQFSFLRGLYVDDLVSRDFETFRARFAARESIKENSLADASIEKSLFNHSHFEQNKRFGPEFKARFHRSLCLHSMAILGLHFGKVSKDQPPDHGVAPTNESQKLADAVKDSIEDLWRKRSVIAGGKTTVLNRDTQIDCLEVFDFLSFLLTKALPHERLASWTAKNAGNFPYHWREDDADTRDPFAVEGWYYFLSYCRWALQPHDLVDLIDNRAWVADNTYPPNKSMYMQVRGMFDAGGPGDADWDVPFSRNRMVRELHYTEGLEMVGAEEPCWWDHLRHRLGSPFLSKAMPKYLAEIDEMERLETE